MENNTLVQSYFAAYQNARDDTAGQKEVFAKAQRELSQDGFKTLISLVMQWEQILDTPTYTVREYLHLQDCAVDMADEARRMAEAESMETLKEQEAELKAAQTRINALLDANLKAQDYRRQLDELKAQGDRIEAQGRETGHGVAVLVQHLPDAKKPPVITLKEALTIMKAKAVTVEDKDGKDRSAEVTERTIRNWIKAGRAAKTGTPISWDDLATIETWAAWVDTYVAAFNSRITSQKICSEHAAKVEAEKARRRSPTA